MSTSRGILAFGRFPKHRIEFNKVLSCSAVAPIQQKSLLVMLHRKTQLAQPTMSIADIVLDIGVAWVAQCGKLERRDGPTPIPYLPRWHRSANLPMEVSLPSLGQVLRATFQRSSATGIQRQRIAAGAISAPSSAAIMTERVIVVPATSSSGAWRHTPACCATALSSRNTGRLAAIRQPHAACRG